MYMYIYLIAIVCVHDCRFILWVLAQCRPCADGLLWTSRHIQRLEGSLLGPECFCHYIVSIRVLVWSHFQDKRAPHIKTSSSTLLPVSHIHLSLLSPTDHHTSGVFPLNPVVFQYLKIITINQKSSRHLLPKPTNRRSVGSPGDAEVMELLDALHDLPRYGLHGLCGKANFTNIETFMSGPSKVKKSPFVFLI